MKVTRCCLLAVFVFALTLVNSGCTGDDTGKVTGPVDASKAYKSSDEAARDMAKSNTLPPKK